MDESDMPLNSEENADMISDEAKSDTVETPSISFASDGTPFLEEVSSRYKPEDEFASPKTSSRNVTSEIILSEKSFSRSNNGAEVHKKPPTTFGIEEKYSDSILCSKPSSLENLDVRSDVTKSGTVEIPSISFASDGKPFLEEVSSGCSDVKSDETKSDTVKTPSTSCASDGTPFLEEVSSRYKPEDKFSSPKTSSINETSEIILSEKSFSSSNNVDRQKLFDAEAHKKPPTTSGFEEKYSDSILCNKPSGLKNVDVRSDETKLGTMEIPSISCASDGKPFLEEVSSRCSDVRSDKTKSDTVKTPSTSCASDETPFLEEVSSRYKPEDEYSSKKTSYINETSEVVLSEKSFSSSNNIDRLKLFDDEANKKPPTTSGIEEKYSDSILCNKSTNLESEETGSKSSIFDASDKKSFFLEIPSAYKLRDRIILPDSSSHTPSQNNMSFDNSADIASEPATPSSLFDDNSSGIWDYYDDDEDLERFCQQEVATLKKIDLKAKALKVENRNSMGSRINSISSLASLDKKCETPTFQFILKEVEPTENSANTWSSGPLHEQDLLMEIQKFFSENPMVDEMTCINQDISSRYSTDEFAQQHGFTVDENEVIENEVIENEVIENEVDEDEVDEDEVDEDEVDEDEVDEDEVDEDEVDEDEVDEDEVVSIRNELEDDTAIEMESLEPDSNLRRLGKLLEKRPFSILMTLLKFYLSSYNTYSY